MARARIQQEYKGTTMKASSSAGWTIKSVPPAMLCEVSFLHFALLLLPHHLCHLLLLLPPLRVPVHLVKQLLIRKPPGQRCQYLQALLYQVPAWPLSLVWTEANQLSHMERLSGGTDEASLLMCQ
ncbi:unnamed protein product [Ixodes persulcatus]